MSYTHTHTYLWPSDGWCMLDAAVQEAESTWKAWVLFLAYPNSWAWWHTPVVPGTEETEA